MSSLGIEPNQDEIRRMIAEADIDGSGNINFTEFLAMMTSRMVSGRRACPSVVMTAAAAHRGVAIAQTAKDSEEAMMHAFRLFDDDGTGKITLRNLKRVSRELGENLTDAELQAMIDAADQDGDGESTPRRGAGDSRVGAPPGSKARRCASQRAGVSAHHAAHRQCLVSGACHTEHRERSPSTGRRRRQRPPGALTARRSRAPWHTAPHR